MKFPLFVKALDSYGSIGLSKKSVCHTYEACEAQVKEMQQTFEQVLIEEFIDGAEFSLLVIGDSTRPGAPLDVFPPAQRVFDPTVAEDERFLSYHLVWEEGGTRYKYMKVDKDRELLMELARKAYECMGGNGFGRIDVRRRYTDQPAALLTLSKRDATGEYFILEVNATCGVGYDASSAEILKLSGLTVHYLIERVLEIGGHDPRKQDENHS